VSEFASAQGAIINHETYCWSLEPTRSLRFGIRPRLSCAAPRLRSGSASLPSLRELRGSEGGQLVTRPKAKRSEDHTGPAERHGEQPLKVTATAVGLQ
jgi:hypothetical protein